MDFFFTPSLVLAPLRIIVFLIFIYVINIIIIRKASKRRDLDYFMLRFPLFISVLIIITLILTQLNTYDLFVILILFVFISLFMLLNLNFKKPIRQQLKKIKKRFIIYIIRSLERGEPLLGKKNLKKHQHPSNQYFNTLNKDHRNKIIIVIILGLLAFAVRYYSLSFDTYLLSDIWYSDLNNLKDISKEQWFFHQGTMMGLFSTITFYYEITGITDAMVLTSFGFIESILVTISVFWTVNKFTKSKIIPGLITSLSYLFLYPLLPINIELITQPKSITFGFTIVLPVLVYAFNPKSLTLVSKKYFRIMVLFMFSIINIDMFLSLYVLPVILLIAFIFNFKTHKKLMIALVNSYLLAIGFTIIMLIIAALIQEKDLLTFVNSNLYSFKNYTYAPQLILPLKELLSIYLIVSLTLLVISSYLWLRNKKNKLLFMTSLLLCCLFTLPNLSIDFIDPDLLNQVLLVIIPILIGLSFYTLYIFLGLKKIKIGISIPTKIASTLIALILISIILNSKYLVRKPNKSYVNREVIKVYDQMNNDLLPFSYGVVNNYMNSRLGDDRHFFLNYSYFSKDYIENDEIYNAHKGDNSYFKKNPEHILPQSIFVFVYNDNALKTSNNGLIAEEQQNVLQSINLLQQKGRPVQIYYKTPILTVYEIINQPKSSNITDLLL